MFRSQWQQLRERIKSLLAPPSRRRQRSRSVDRTPLLSEVFEERTLLSATWAGMHFAARGFDPGARDSWQANDAFFANWRWNENSMANEGGDGYGDSATTGDSPSNDSVSSDTLADSTSTSSPSSSGGQNDDSPSCNTMGWQSSNTWGGSSSAAISNTSTETSSDGTSLASVANDADPAVQPASTATSNSSSSATHLVFQVQPSNGTAGQSFSVTVAVEDSSGDVVTTDDSTITLRVHGPGRFSGDGRSMTATASGGVATFNDLVLDRAGTYTLRAWDSSSGGVTSDSFDISPDTATQLVFLRSDPRFGTVDHTLRTVRVAIEDQFGNIIKSDNSTQVTLSIDAGPTTTFGSGSTLEATVSNGIASFNNLLLATTGTYTLTATDTTNSEISSATSHSLHIVSEQQGEWNWGWGWGGGGWGWFQGWGD